MVFFDGESPWISRIVCIRSWLLERVGWYEFVAEHLQYLYWPGMIRQVCAAIALLAAYLCSCCLTSREKVKRWGRPTRKIENMFCPFEVLILSLACAKQCSWAQGLQVNVRCHLRKMTGTLSDDGCEYIEDILITISGLFIQLMGNW